MSNKEKNQIMPLEINPGTPEFFSGDSRPPSQTSLKSCTVQSNIEIKNQNNGQENSINSSFPKEENFTFNEQKEYEGDRIIGPNFTLSKDNFWLIPKNDENKKINFENENLINKTNNSQEIFIPNLLSERIFNFKVDIPSETKKLEGNKKNRCRFISTKNSKINENNIRNTNKSIIDLSRVNDDKKKNIKEILNDDNILTLKKEEKNKFAQNEKNNGENVILKNIQLGKEYKRKSFSTEKKIKKMFESNIVLRTKTPKKKMKFKIKNFGLYENEVANNTIQNVNSNIEKINVGINSINLNENKVEMNTENWFMKSNIIKNNIVNINNNLENSTSDQMTQEEKDSKNLENFEESKIKEKSQGKNELSIFDDNNFYDNKKNRNTEIKKYNENNKFEIKKQKEEKKKEINEKTEEDFKIEKYVRKTQSEKKNLNFLQSSEIELQKFLSPTKNNININNNKILIIDPEKLFNKINKKISNYANKENNKPNEIKEIKSNTNISNNQTDLIPKKLKNIQLIDKLFEENQFTQNKETFLNKKRNRSISNNDNFEKENKHKNKYEYLIHNEITSYYEIKTDRKIKKTNLIFYRNEENYIIEYYCNEKKEKNEENEEVIKCKCAEDFCDGYGVLIFSANYSENLSKEEKRKEVKFILLKDHIIKSKYHKSNWSTGKMTDFMKYTNYKGVLIKRDNKNLRLFRAIMLI